MDSLFANWHFMFQTKHYGIVCYMVGDMTDSYII